MSHDPLEAHARLLTTLSDRVRTHLCLDGPDQAHSNRIIHRRKARRLIDDALVGEVGRLMRCGYSASLIRIRLRIGYNTIMRAIALLEKNNNGSSDS